MTVDDYKPLDLSAYCNAGVETLGADATAAPVGEQLFHGLPFRIGQAAGAFVLFGDGGRTLPLSIPFDNTNAYTAIIAHRLLGSDLPNGGPVGASVATYTFHLCDGSEHRIPIRERFEIGDIGMWGQLPFLARSDQRPGLFDRWSGPWDAAGARQTESKSGWPRAYYLWTWRNPTPDVPVASLEIARLDGRFLVAAITLGLTDEEPFAREGMLPVRIDLKDATLAERTFGPGGADVNVLVDRGVAGYPYPLSRRAPDEFVRDAFAGWGEERNRSCSPVYVDVSATPSRSSSRSERTLSPLRVGRTCSRVVSTRIRSA
jgi:hypothetical protein